MRRLFAFIVLVVFTVTGYASRPIGVQLGSIRCAGEVVNVGERAFRLIESCGSPDYREVVHYSRVSDRARSANQRLAVSAEESVLLATEEWVYKQGRGRLIKVLTVTGGVLTDIRSVSRQ